MKPHRLLAAMVLAWALILPAQAARSIDPDRQVSLTVTVKCDQTALAEAPVSLYRICEMDEGGNLAVLLEFAPLAEILNIRGDDPEKWREAAQKTEQYLLEHPRILPADTRTTDPEGRAIFPETGAELPQGLYLVGSIHHPQGDWVYTADAFFVMLPARTEEGWEYTREARAKAEQQDPLVSLRVIKEWKDKYWENHRPKEIRIILYRDELPYDSVTLPQNGKWVYRWGGLPADHSWWVQEDPVADYRSEVRKQGNTFYITNTYHRSDPQIPLLPQTGQLWWPATVLSAAGLLLTLLGLLRKREEKP